MHRKEPLHTMDSLFTFLLLLTFLLFSLLLAGTGSAIYRKSTDSLNENYTSRTALSYLAEKIRQHEEGNAVTLTTIGDLPSFMLKETLDGEEFATYIYYYDGALRELFTRTSTIPTPEMGSPVVELSSCTFEEIETAAGSSGRMFAIHAADKNEKKQSLLVHVSSQTP